MRIAYKTCEQLPPLAWCSKFGANDDVMSVWVGNNVECKDDGFVSGVWDGKFEEFDFVDTHFRCCVGCKLLNNNELRGG